MKKKRAFLDVGLDCDENRNPVGYHVIVVTPDGKVLDEYRAGNAPWESAQRIPANNPNALDKETLIKYARQTAKETPDEFPEYDICWDGKVEGCECA